MYTPGALMVNAAVSAVSRNRRKEVVGVVTSDKMQKTISVEISRFVEHIKYGKFMRRSTVCKAHDEKGEAKVGDTVRLTETRPLSKTKRWRLVAVVKRGRAKASVAAAAPEPVAAGAGSAESATKA